VVLYRRRRHSLASTSIAALSAAFILGVPSLALAYRPFDGTDAEVAEFGELELEWDTFLTFANAGIPELTTPVLTINVGVYRRLELVLETNNELHRPEVGKVTDRIAETHLFLKGVVREGFAQDKTGPSVAIEAGAWLPNPNGLVGDGIGGSVSVICSVQVAQMIAHFNVLGAFDLEKHPELFASIILEGPRSHLVRPISEILAEHTFGGSTTYSALVGAIWKANKALDVDFAVRALSTDSIPMGQVRLGFTLRAPLWHPAG
jgi:hypothetical protein